MTVSLDDFKWLVSSENRKRDIERRIIVIGYDEDGYPEFGVPSSFLIAGQTQQGKSVIAAHLACWFAVAGKLTEGWTDFVLKGGNLMRRVGIRH